MSERQKTSIFSKPISDLLRENSKRKHQKIDNKENFDYQFLDSISDNELERHIKEFSN